MPSPIEESKQQMLEAMRLNADLMATSTTVSVGIQAASSTAHTMNGAAAAGGEVAKATGNDIRNSAKAS